MMKKRFAVFVLLSAVCFALFAGGEKDAAYADGTAKLTIYARAYTYQQDAPWKVAERKLNAAHPELKITYSYQGFGWSDLRTGFLTAAAGGEAPDVVMTDIIWLGEYADGGLITPVTRQAEAWSEWADVAPMYREATKWNGKIYGPWLNTDVRVMAYNKKLFRRAGLDPNKPPRTWSELRTAAKTISDALAPAAYGFGFPAMIADETAQTFYAYLFSLGGSILTKDLKKAAFNSPQGVQALNELINYVKSGATPTSIVSGDYGDIQKGVFQDKFAMAFMTKAFGLAKDLVPNLTPETYQNDFGVVTIPRADNGKPATMSGGYLLCIPTGSKNKDLAWEFISYAAGAEAQFGYTAARGYVPTFTSLKNKAENYYKIDPYFGVIMDQVNNAYFRPSIPQYTEISAEIQQQIQAAVMGQKDAKRALDDAAAAVNAILAD